MRSARRRPLATVDSKLLMKACAAASEMSARALPKDDSDSLRKQIVESASDASDETVHVTAIGGSQMGGISAASSREGITAINPAGTNGSLLMVMDDRPRIELNGAAWAEETDATIAAEQQGRRYRLRGSQLALDVMHKWRDSDTVGIRRGSVLADLVLPKRLEDNSPKFADIFTK